MSLHLLSVAFCSAFPLSPWSPFAFAFPFQNRLREQDFDPQYLPCPYQINCLFLASFSNSGRNSHISYCPSDCYTFYLLIFRLLLLENVLRLLNNDISMVFNGFTQEYMLLSFLFLYYKFALIFHLWYLYPVENYLVFLLRLLLYNTAGVSTVVHNFMLFCRVTLNIPF